MDIILFIILLAGMGIGFWFLWRTLKTTQPKKDDGQSLLVLNQINELRNTLDKKLGLTQADLKASAATFVPGGISPIGE